ncbi:MAG TPA: TIR domain-containing protein [Blastocatellia bacterium]|jgi:Tol biopolymer transport system component
MSSVFLSHSHKDKEFVRRLAYDLRANGVKVWVDEAEILVGDSLIQKIGQAIEEMDYLGIILSPNSVESDWVRQELEIAMIEEIKGRRIKVLPILYHRCKLPHFLEGKKYADFTLLAEYQTGLQSLLKKLVPQLEAQSKIGAVQTTLSIEHFFTRLKRHKFAVLITAATIMLILVCGAYWLVKQLGQPQSPAGFQAIKMTRLTTTGNIPITAVSPDGKYILYVLEDENKESVWLKQVTTGSATQIVPPVNGHYSGLTFSRDGIYIYYTFGLPGRGDLYQIPLLGGMARKLIINVRSRITLSPYGHQLAFVRTSKDDKETYLMIANADGSQERILAARKQPAFFDQVAWSPDGEEIACGVFDPLEPPAWSLVGISTKTGRERTISAQRWNLIGSFEWLMDGSGLILSANDRLSNSTQLWKISYPRQEVQRITTDLNLYRGVSITADGRSLVTIQDTHLTSIWTTEPFADSGRARKIASEVITSNQGGAYFDWTPDGRIVYTSSASGSYELWVMESDGTGNRQLTFDAEVQHLSVSPDGRYIVFNSFGNKGFHIWRADITGGNIKRLTNGTSEFGPQCSPDAMWVVYYTFERGEYRSWKVPVDGGDPVPISNKGFYKPLVSPDGKLIACVDADHGQTVIAPFEGEGAIKTLQVPYIQWTPDSRSLLYISLQNDNIWEQPIDGGPPKQLTNFKSEVMFRFSLSRDGKQIVLSRGSYSSDVVLITNLM